MDGLKRPVGDESPIVYWRRRVVVVIAIVLLALLVWWIIGLFGGNDASPSNNPTNSPAASTSPAADASSDPSRPCTDADFSVVTGPKDPVFSGDDVPTFTVTVASISDSACIVDPSKESKIFITSGNEPWFDSSTCTDYAVFDSEPFVLAAEATHELSTIWNRGRNDDGCAAELQSAVSGYYWITTTVASVTADALQFQIN